MKIEDYLSKLKVFKENKKFPTKGFWAQGIHLSADMWSEIFKIQARTSSTGKEYEVSFFDVDGEIIGTTPFEGTEEQVIEKIIYFIDIGCVAMPSARYF